jgi:hypothetical protein
MKEVLGCCYHGSLPLISDAGLCINMSKYTSDELLLFSSHRDAYKLRDKRNVGGI